MKSKKIIFYTIFVIVILFSLEAISRIAFIYILPKHYDPIRRVLSGDNVIVTSYQRSHGQAYLLYTPMPNITIEGKKQHNSQGYRGNPVSMDRTPGVCRILFLGGSTTYGWKVYDSKYTYPAFSEGLLNQDLSKECKKVEVINAGLPFGTSAELFSHYHYKFHYYKPDLVVINTGGNDAYLPTIPYYQPDYSHNRQPIISLKPLPKIGRIALKSRLLSMLIIPLIYDADKQGGSFIRPPGDAPRTIWYPRMTKKKYTEDYPDIPYEEDGFVHNIDSLIREILNDDAKILLVGFREAPINDFTKSMLKGIAKYRGYLKELAKKYPDVDFAPFPANVISPKNWVDKCHLNENGQLEKAKYVTKYIKKIFNQKKQDTQN